jgi:hypothetical protein
MYLCYCWGVGCPASEIPIPPAGGDGFPDENPWWERSERDRLPAGGEESVDEARERRNVSIAERIVRQILKEERAPAPVQGPFEPDRVKYDPRTLPGENPGTVLAGQHITTGEVEVTHDITVFSPGAKSLEEAIVTVAHEYGHYNASWGEKLAEAYGKGVLEVYRGRRYPSTAPRP